MRLTAIPILLLIALPALAEEGNWNYNDNFHPPASEMEKITDKIILDSAALFDLSDKEKNYYLALTPDLVDEIFLAQENAAKSNCTGAEGLGTQCGLNYNPIICARNIADIYFYKVDKEDDYSARVYASWREDGDKATKYELVNVDKEWRIDAITCANGDEFNN